MQSSKRYSTVQSITVPLPCYSTVILAQARPVASAGNCHISREASSKQAHPSRPQVFKVSTEVKRNEKKVIHGLQEIHKVHSMHFPAYSGQDTTPYVEATSAEAGNPMDRSFSLPVSQRSFSR